MVGVDAIGSCGGLLVLGWNSSSVHILHTCPNFIACNVVEPSGKSWYTCFVYGSPVLEDKPQVWHSLLIFILPLPNCLLIGDFNQGELHQDKLGGSNTIKGWTSFMERPLNFRLLDVPFQGPYLVILGQIINMAIISS